MTGKRVKIGIEGLDTMLGGGLVPGSITAIIGSYGTGKTTFALHFIWEGVSRGEHVIYISLEEREERIFEYMAQKGWDYRQFVNKSITVLRLDPSEFNLAINRIKNELPDLIRNLGATRVVIDPVSLFEDLFDGSAKRRQEMFRLVESLRDQRCTVVLTSETDSNNQYISRHNLIEYLCDTVILLNYVRPADLTGVHLAVEVVKMRLSQHSREIKPYEIQKDRILVYSEANVF
ncbi:MAG TPA: KaiC domain-containing protein [Methanoregulaceae archaeon]|nr:KaiC domain-containing protein [Methanoregulaceae archaeon]